MLLAFSNPLQLYNSFQGFRLSATHSSYIIASMHRDSVERKLSHRKEEKEIVETIADMGEQRKRSLLQIYIPEEIILQILARLPVKTLLRFKSVCKLWQSLITDPKFSLSSDGRERAIFCCSEGRPKESGKYVLEKGKILDSLDHNLSLQPLPNPVGKALDYKFLFLGSCNGLLLFCASTAFFHSVCIYLWNPSTRRLRELTQLYGLIKNSPSFKGLGMLSGLCFDRTSDDYKIVLINENSTVYVASLRRGIEWKAISFPYEIPKKAKVTRSGVLIKGHLHWLVKEQTTSNCAIVYFDETTNRFENLPMPKPQRYPNWGYEVLYQLGDLHGCLCLLVSRYQAGSLQVFVMREYGAKESWTNVNLFNLPEWLPPLYSTRLGGTILFRERCYIVAYNLKDKSLKKVKLRRNMFIDDGPIEYVETLASVH